MPTRRETTPTIRCPKSDCIAITSSTRSMRTSLSTPSCANNWRAISWRPRVHAKNSPSDVVATGFLALSRRYATAPYELWHFTRGYDRHGWAGRFLAYRLRCARCHDHKFDPVTTADYYALYGIFNSTKFAYAGSEEFQSKNFGRSDFMPLMPMAECKSQVDAYRTKIDELKRQIADLEQNDPLAKDWPARSRVEGAGRSGLGSQTATPQDVNSRQVELKTARRRAKGPG